MPSDVGRGKGWGVPYHLQPYQGSTVGGWGWGQRNYEQANVSLPLSSPCLYRSQRCQTFLISSNPSSQFRVSRRGLGLSAAVGYNAAMRYSLRSLMILTVGGTLAGWGLAALIHSTAMSLEVSFPIGVAAIYMVALFGGGMIAGGTTGAWLASKLEKVQR